jgi:hypothetical protein
MPGIVIDTFAPIKRQREKIAKLEGKIFELRRELEDAKEELARLVHEDAAPAKESA